MTSADDLGAWLNDTFSPGAYIITGGSGALGKAVAERIARHNVTLHLADHDTSGCDDTARELRGRGARVRTHRLDVTDPNDVRALVDSVAEDEPIRGLVTLAGVLQHGDIATVADEDWDRVLDVNLKGTFLICKHSILRMRETGGGSIVTTSSMSGRTKSAVSAVNYVASKGGVIGLTMALAAQEAKHDIRVNCVAPGHVASPMYWSIPEEQRAKVADSVPMGRPGTPTEIAAAFDFLLSKDASYITGQTLSVNGGAFAV